MNHNLNRPLKLGLAAILVLIAAIVSMALWHSLLASRQAERHYRSALGAAELGKATSVLWQLHFAFAQFLSGDEAARQKILTDETRWVKEVDGALAAFETTALSAAETAALATLRRSYEQYTETRPKWFALVREGKTDEAMKWGAKTTAPLGAATVKAFGELTALQTKAAEDERAAQAERAFSGFAVLLGVGVPALLLSLWLGWWLNGLLGGMVGVTHRVARSVAEGDLGTQVRGAGEGPMGKVLLALRDMVTGLASKVASMRHIAENVAGAAAEVVQGNQTMRQGHAQHASALETTAASMQRLGSTVKLNADNAKQASQLALGASHVAIKGGEVVGQVIDTMKGINHSSAKIADIIGVIDGIAFQTNILALNAAVEAARAGEQGRGFAVVASEVRSLAHRSAKAAKEIKGLIGASVERVEQGTALVDQAGATMAEVVRSIQRVTDIVGEISAASVEQSAGVAQVGEAINQLGRARQESAAHMELGNAAAEQLNDRAQHLLRTLAAFKLGPEHLPPGTPVVQPPVWSGVERRGPQRSKSVARPIVKAKAALPAAAADGWVAF